MLEITGTTRYAPSVRLRRIRDRLAVKAVPVHPKSPALGARENGSHAEVQITQLRGVAQRLVHDLPVGNPQELRRMRNFTAGMDNPSTTAQELCHESQSCERPRDGA
jgi:hypothetical protein